MKQKYKIISIGEEDTFYEDKDLLVGMVGVGDMTFDDDDKSYWGRLYLKGDNADKWNKKYNANEINPSFFFAYVNVQKIEDKGGDDYTVPQDIQDEFDDAFDELMKENADDTREETYDYE